MPPAMADVKQHTADDVLKMMNKVPLFMTELDETDEQGNENVALEAIKALAYEGSKAEQAENFRQQGNEHARMKNWLDAKEFYTKAIGVLKAPSKSIQDRIEEMPDIDIVEIDEEAEAKKEKETEEASYVNRALCNLELKNYRSCTFDCAAALRINFRNVKAWYRSASACLALDKIPEASDACTSGLNVDANNSALQNLVTKIQEREKHLAQLSRQREEREERERAEERALKLALKARNIHTRATGKAPDLEDAKVKLERPLDASSTIFIPTMLLYPLHLQTDFIKDLSEHVSLQEQLSYVLPLPWDEKHEYTVESIDCYMETTTGGLIKVGKKLPMTKTLTTGKVEVIDGMLKVYVIPRSRAQEWIDDFKKKRRPTG
ncbi:TPR repeat protein-like protein [Viridothelium virens]|uniref:TPR repeat protein-like protein n=1 Tax=Viridothelium virens TaxID=1048519 RepID=A0A6A6HGW6_VIRVR|nr:TPR repeat protein-like protein [Viridothelium virens]